MSGTDDGDQPNHGQRALAISNAISRIHRDYYGRGPSCALTVQISELC